MFVGIVGAGRPQVGGRWTGALLPPPPPNPRVNVNPHHGRAGSKQGTHYTGKTGKTGKMAKKNTCQGKHREFGNVAKTQGIWFAHVINSLILTVKYISIFVTKISQKMLTLVKSVKSV